jgi:uncharacterized protein (DUF302 family)
MNIGFSKTLNGKFDDIVTRATEALKTQGFGVLTDIDVKATLKAKIDVDRRPYRILGACNPPLAHRALNADSEVGLLLPCNVVVEELESGQIKVSFIDPDIMVQMFDNAEMRAVAAEAKKKLQAACAAL